MQVSCCSAVFPPGQPTGHAPGAMHIPYARLRDRVREIPNDRPIVVYCAGGIRSSLAASMVEASGRKVANMRGGFTAWDNAGLPVSRAAR